MHPDRIVSGQADIAQMGQEIFLTVLEVASGRKTVAEALGLHNYMAVFNPAPIT